MALDLKLLGTIPESTSVYTALLSGKTMAEVSDKSVSLNVDNICDRLLGIWPKHDVNLLDKFNRLMRRITLTL